MRPQAVIDVPDAVHVEGIDLHGLHEAGPKAGNRNQGFAALIIQEHDAEKCERFSDDIML
ncbi:hypothetical protein GCM10007919_71950 [Rhizobium indigoferae]|nr:hypothetical protein GCM10007919_71950 [Rhizobium indigoferae]